MEPSPPNQDPGSPGELSPQNSQNKATRSQEPGTRFRLPSDWRFRVAEGLILGGFTGLCVSTLGITELLHQEFQENILLLPAILGALVALSRARVLLRGCALGAFALMAIVGYTPIMNRLLPPLIRSDPLQHVPAIVVISTALHKDNTLNAQGQERFVHGYLLLKQGWGDNVVLTRAIPKIGDQSPVVMDQMRTLGLNYPVERVGPVTNTHDEAVLVAQLARARGWKRVILVTHPWHMRRARAVFEKAGLDVLCSPCVEGSYDMSDLTSPRGRYAAFNNWLHETVGYQVYQLRGWL